MFHKAHILADDKFQVDYSRVRRRRGRKKSEMLSSFLSSEVGVLLKSSAPSHIRNQAGSAVNALEEGRTILTLNEQTGNERADVSLLCRRVGWFIALFFKWNFPRISWFGRLIQDTFHFNDESLTLMVVMLSVRRRG